jgi:hypothetical protein
MEMAIEYARMNAQTLPVFLLPDETDVPASVSDPEQEATRVRQRVETLVTTWVQNGWLGTHLSPRTEASTTPHHLLFMLLGDIWWYCISRGTGHPVTIQRASRGSQH